MKIALPTLPSSPALFMHIYKTAGTTIEYILQSFYHTKEIFPGYHNPDYLKIPKDELEKYRLFMGHADYRVVEVLPESTILATVLREPVSFAISLFNQVRTRPDNPRYAEFESKKLSFMGFLTDETALTLYRNRQTRQIVGQWAYAKIFADEKDEEAAKRKCLAIAKERLQAFDFVGITERLEDSITLLSSLLGIPRPAYVPRLNVSERKLISVAELPEEAKALTLEVYDLDAELYAFASDLLDARFRAMATDAASGRGGLYEMAPVDRATIDLSGPMNGIGWWPISKDDAMVRHTGPGKISTIGLPLTANMDHRLAIRARSAFSQNLRNIQIRVNDAIVHPMVTPCAEGSFLVQADIRKDYIREGPSLTEIEIEVGEVAAPCTLDSEFDDIRPIGLSVYSLEISPL